MAAAKHTADEFTATKFSTAEDKAKAVNALLVFVDSGFQESKFTKRVYEALYIHMFGHIAHYNKVGFYDEWFATDEDRQRWMEYAARGGAYGFATSSSYDWADAERVVAEEMRTRLGIQSGF